MKKNLSIYLLSLFALTSMAEAKNVKHERNKETFIGGENIHLQTRKKEIIPHATMDFEKPTKAACTKLPGYIESTGEALLATAGKTPQKIQEDRKLFHNIVSNLLKQGGNYGYVGSGFGERKDEEEFLLSHKIAALKLLLNAAPADLSDDKRAESAYLLASLLEKYNLASSQEISNYYHQVLRAVPQTTLGHKAWEAQVRLLSNDKQIQQDDVAFKIDALESILKDNNSSLTKEMRSQAYYLMGGLLETQKPASSKEIFNYYHSALREAPTTEFGRKAWEAQVRLLNNKQIQQHDLSLATFAIMVNNSPSLKSPKKSPQKKSLINGHKQRVMAATSQYKNAPRAEILRRIEMVY